MRRLSVSNVKGFSICKNTLAGWIRSLIKLAYEKCPHHLIQLSAVKPHEVRVMSASLAWRTNGLKGMLSVGLAKQLLLPSTVNQEIFTSLASLLETLNLILPKYIFA